ncbi:hypothetical protein HDU79_000739 [Rhizoclosmatium sp. JEL0117]|nr:hypothetical protein HDU79_000739 [Rhizoclosmatium sp. JEL0117]
MTSPLLARFTALITETVDEMGLAVQPSRANDSWNHDVVYVTDVAAWKMSSHSSAQPSTTDSRTHAERKVDELDIRIESMKEEYWMLLDKENPSKADVAKISYFENLTLEKALWNERITEDRRQQKQATLDPVDCEPLHVLASLAQLTFDPDDTMRRDLGLLSKRSSSCFGKLKLQEEAEEE